MNKYLVICIVALAAGNCSAQNTDTAYKSSINDFHGAMSNEAQYQSGAQERARVSAEARQYADLTGRDLPESAFETPAPAGIMSPSSYAKMRSKTAGFISNINYWREQLTANYANLEEYLKANDLETSGRVLKLMQEDSAALDNELRAVKTNNLKAKHWPKKLSNEEQYQSGVSERAGITSQSAVYADLEGRDIPVNELKNAGLAFAQLSEKNDAFISNIVYWREQLTGNHGNLLEALKVNDLSTARTLLNYMKQDSDSLDNEIAAVQANNKKAH